MIQGQSLIYLRFLKKQPAVWFNPGLKHGCLINTSLNKKVALGRDLKEWSWVKDEPTIVSMFKSKTMDFASIVLMVKKQTITVRQHCRELLIILKLNIRRASKDSN